MLDTKYKNDILTVKLKGEIDHNSAAKLRTAIDSQINALRPKMLELDFSKVGFMDSSGIGIVLGRYNKMIASGGEVVTRNAHGTVKQILEMCGIFSLMKYEEDEKEAEK